MIKLAVSSPCRVIVYWGEAHRISTWLSVILAKAFGKKVVFWTHGIYGNEKGVKRIIRTCFYRLADALLLYGEHGRKQLERAGLPADKLFVINNSLDVNAQRKLIGTYGIENLQNIKYQYCDNPERLLVFVGRLEKSKRLDLLIRAVALLKTRGVAVKALLIGEGSARDELCGVAWGMDVSERIIFYGECYRDEEVLPLLAAADICVSPGEVGLTAMHALVCGTPVITHDDFPNQMPEFEAVIPGYSGAFFRNDDVYDLADKIQGCFLDMDSGRITAENCRAIIDTHYTPEFQRAVFYKAITPLLA
ncbi:hypothetical protein GCM10027180_19670 [Microbulbifer echini]